jgi:formate hydrogenlyase transcriptional activator
MLREFLSSAEPSPCEMATDRVQFETLLSDISAQLVAVDADRVDATVRASLDAVRCFFQADRAALCAISDDRQKAFFSHVAIAEGVSNLLGEFDLTVVFPWVARRAIDRIPVVMSCLDDLPREAAVDRASFAARGTRAALIIPFLTGPIRLDVILLSVVRGDREWPEEYVPRLRLLGEMLVNALERARASERLRQALEEVQHLRERLERENQYLRQEATRRLGPEQIVGRSTAIRRTLALAEQVAATDSTVLLLGETGSGKERFACYIHECSRRRDRPMIRVNCSAIPGPLMESELFGREKGAYTGALSRQIGRFELAHGSTLFLDEIGDLPVEVQVKLLRVLESHTIERLGNPRPVAVHVRIVAATHRDLAAAVREGRFREDLYYRLNVFPLPVPPLRERPEDIPLLVDAFIDELTRAMGKTIDEIDPGSMEALVAYSWPGNVRELRNVVERGMIVATGRTLRIDPPQGEAVDAASRTDLTAVERAHILHVLGDAGWRIRGAHGAAARLGLKPTTLESRLKKLGLTRPGTGSR